MTQTNNTSSTNKEAWDRWNAQQEAVNKHVEETKAREQDEYLAKGIYYGRILADGSRTFGIPKEGIESEMHVQGEGIKAPTPNTLLSGEEKTLLGSILKGELPNSQEEMQKASNLIDKMYVQSTTFDDTDVDPYRYMRGQEEAFNKAIDEHKEQALLMDSQEEEYFDTPDAILLHTYFVFTPRGICKARIVGTAINHRLGTVQYQVETKLPKGVKLVNGGKWILSEYYYCWDELYDSRQDAIDSEIYKL